MSFYRIATAYLDLAINSSVSRYPFAEENIIEGICSPTKTVEVISEYLLLSALNNLIEPTTFVEPE